MESYIEISFFNGVLLLYSSLLYASYITFHPIKNNLILIYAIIISLISVLLWYEKSFICIIFVEIIFFFTSFKYAKKTYLFALMFRYLCMGTSFILYGGSFYNGFYFVPMHKSVLFVWIIYVIGIIYAKSRWRIHICEKNCVYPVTIWIQNQKIKLLGYFDSGNIVSYHGIPVVFMSNVYQSYFQNQSIDIITMKTVLEYEAIQCYCCELQLDGFKKTKVYVHLQKDLSIPCGCNIILNMKVMVG